MNKSKFKKMIYFDANSSSKIRKESIYAFNNSIRIHGNASSTHFFGRKTKKILEKSRYYIAEALNVNKSEIIFTSGASEGNRWIIDSICELGKRYGVKLKIYCSRFEHVSLINNLIHCHLNNLLFFSYFELDENCKILWRKEYVYADALIHIAAHNETGFICNWDKIFKKISNNTIFITDGSQYILREEYIPKRIDMMTISSHKIGGICGCGALILKNRISFLPTPWFGGYQEFGQRPGTEPVGIISSFGIIAKNFKKFIYKHKKLSIFRDYIDKMILNVFTDSRILFKKCKRLPNTTSIIFSFLNNRLLKILIDLSELCISFGSACNSLLFKKSNLLDYFISKEMVFFSIIRISLSNDMPGKVIEKGVIKLIHILKKSKQKNK